MKCKPKMPLKPERVGPGEHSELKAERSVVEAIYLLTLQISPEYLLCARSRSSGDGAVKHRPRFLSPWNSHFGTEDSSSEPLLLVHVFDRRITFLPVPQWQIITLSWITRASLVLSLLMTSKNSQWGHMWQKSVNTAAWRTSCSFLYFYHLAQWHFSSTQKLVTWIVIFKNSQYKYQTLWSVLKYHYKLTIFFSKFNLKHLIWRITLYLKGQLLKQK